MKKETMTFERKPFGQTWDGQNVEEITFSNGVLTVNVITYSGALRRVLVPGKDGQLVDVVQGYDTLEDYQRAPGHSGALVGRYANRIDKGICMLGDKKLQLAVNDGVNHLHGGPTGFSHRVWSAEECEDGVVMSYDAQDMEENYPGALSVRVRYSLSGSTLSIHYLAATDKTTLCNLTNHAYFNLNGAGNGTAMNHTLMLYSDDYTPVLPGAIPTGEIAPVAGTPMDFTEPHLIGERIDADFEQLALCGGYDHNFVVRGELGAMRPAAVMTGDKTGIRMEVATDLPGIQVYAGNYMEDMPDGKEGKPLHKRDAVCLETQFFPDSPNHKNFPQTVLNPGETWDYTTTFTFSC